MSKARPPTTAERAVWELMRELGCAVQGCVSPASIHHCFTGMGGRKDHAAVIPLCRHHHQGDEGIHVLGRRTWQAKYGTEAELLAQTLAGLGL